MRKKEKIVVPFLIRWAVCFPADVDIANDRGEIHPGFNGQVKRSPKFWIDLDQFVVIVPFVKLEFNLRGAAPI